MIGTKKIYFILLALFCLFSAGITAQNPSYFVLDGESGLPFNVIYDMEKDHEGYLVLCTGNGLYRFDGSDFYEIPWKDRLKDDILELKPTKHQRMWGLGLNNVLYEVKTDSVLPLFQWNKDYRSIFRFVAQEDQLWLSSNSNFLFRYDLNESTLDSIDLSKGLPDSKNLSRVIPLHASSERLIVSVISAENSSESYIRALDLSNGKITTLMKDGSIGAYGSFESNDSTFLIKRKQNSKSEVFVVLKDKVVAANSYSKLIEDIQIIRADKYGKEFFFCGGNGIKILQEDNRVQRHLLKGVKTTACQLVKDKGIWVSTLENGLYYFPNYQSNTYGAENSGLLLDGLTELEYMHPYVYMADKVGTIFSFDPNNSKFTIIKKDNEHISYLKKIEEQSGERIYFSWRERLFQIESTQAISLNKNAPNKDLTVWNGLELNSSTNSATVYIKHDQLPFLKKLLPLDFIEKNSTHKEELDSWIIHLSNRRSPMNTINRIDSSLWIVLRDQVIRFSRESIDTIKFRGENIHASAIDCDPKGRVWISTATKIFYLDKGQKEVNGNSIKPIPNITKINASGENVLLASDQGVYMLGTEIKKWSRLDGLPSDITYDVLRHDSLLFIASKKGLTVLNGTYPANEHKPAIRLLEFKINDEVTAIENGIQFEHSENNLEFSLASLALNSYKNLHYYYRLATIESKWNESQNPKNIRYPNLQDGSYVFEAYVEDYFGNKSELLQIEFEIVPPFWKTLWFWSVMLVMLLLILFLIAEGRVRRIKRQRDLKNKLIRSEIEGLKSQINPHFVFNALNSIQSLILKEDIKNSNLFLGKFAHLLRNVLNHSSKDLVTLAEEMELLQLYLDLEGLRFQDQLKVELLMSPDIDKNGIQLPPLLLQPHVENSLKHGLLHSEKEEKKLTIDFSIQNDRLRCRIEDNGIGRTASAEINKRRAKYHQSYASAATEKRIDLINQNNKNPILISIHDLDEGTRVELSFPLNYS